MREREEGLADRGESQTLLKMSRKEKKAVTDNLEKHLKWSARNEMFGGDLGVYRISRKARKQNKKEEVV